MIRNAGGGTKLDRNGPPGAGVRWRGKTLPSKTDLRAGTKPAIRSRLALSVCGAVLEKLEMLQSVRDLGGAAIAAEDGNIGSVEQVFFDDERWSVRYLIVKTGRRLASRRVLLSPRAVVRFDPSLGEVAVRLSRAAVAAGPDVDTRQPVSRQKELELHRLFTYPLYWNGVEPWNHVDSNHTREYRRRRRSGVSSW